MEMNIKPSSFFEADYAQYKELVKQPGIGFNENDPLIKMSGTIGDQGNHRFSNKFTRYLQTFRFGFVLETFKSMLASQKVNNRARIAYYMVPMTMALGAATMNLVQQSFVVYLKYQAMVDVYHIRS
jgi:hypothetical protein